MSRSQAALGSPCIYIFEPMSAKIIPYSLKAVAMARDWTPHVVGIVKLDFKRNLWPIKGVDEPPPPVLCLAGHS